jgi:hypothetical protein
MSRMRWWLWLVAIPLCAADSDVEAILKRLVEAQHQNDKRAQQYTYVEETERFTFDKNGSPHNTGSATHDVIFVEGLKFNKLVARNGKPLSASDQAKVEKNMRLTAEERRKHQRPTAPGGMITFSGLFSSGSLDLGSLSELPKLFDNRVSGEEEIRGHKTWVIESTPRKGYMPMSGHERQVLVFNKKFWVDEADGVLVRGVYTVAAEDSFLRPGSTVTFEYEKVDPDTWEAVSLTLEFSRSKDKVFKPTGRTVYRMSKFQKFDVQSTITVMDSEK